MKTKNQYEWKIPSFAKDINVDDAMKEFKRIERRYGSLTPENIFEASQADESLFHPIFEWDRNKCFIAHNLQLARILINNVEVTIISDSERHKIPVYEVIQTEDEGRKYKHIETLTFSEIEQIKMITIKSLNQMSQKLRLYKKFDRVIEPLHTVIHELELVEIN
jgi:hypothetical protein